MADGATFSVAEAPSPWPAIDLAMAERDPYPPPALLLADIFPAPWVAWIERAAELKSAPQDYVAMALLATAGALIGNARWASPWDGWREPPVVFAALVGNPSSGKSPAIDACAEILADLEREENEDFPHRQRQHSADKAVSAERRRSWEGEVKSAVQHKVPPPDMPAAACEPPSPTRRRILTTEPTTEKAARLSAANPGGLLLLRDELTGWIAGMDRYSGASGADRAFWLQAYGGRPWMPDRVKDEGAEIAVPHLAWSVLGGIQPDRLATAMLAGDDDGLAARFLFTWPARNPVFTAPPNGRGLGFAAAWLRALRTLSWTPPEPVVLPLTPDAVAHLSDWRRDCAGKEQGATGLFLSWLGKLPGAAVRLALIFEHLAWCVTPDALPPESIGAAAFLRAATFLATYAEPMARRCFGEAALPAAERDARMLLRWLLRQRPCPDRLNAKALRRMADGPGIRDVAQMDAALAELDGLGVVRQAEPSRGGMGGRSRKDWLVHPAVVARGR